ncbi:MAG TPA: (2Fe-2S)-binding protein [Aliidongia sp.]|nr:(2Fe-2S)-binding protein [Aliidongia sp.]
MYVCLCNAVTDGQIRAAAGEKECSVAGLYRLLGVQPKCGKCVPVVREILSERADSEAAALCALA